MGAEDKDSNKRLLYLIWECCEDSTFGILRYHLICDTCPQLKGFFSLVNQSNPVPWIPLPTLRLAWTQALARGWPGWAAVHADPAAAHLCQPQTGGFTPPPALWLLILLLDSVTAPTSTPTRCFLHQISANACSCLQVSSNSRSEWRQQYETACMWNDIQWEFKTNKKKEIKLLFNS